MEKRNTEMETEEQKPEIEERVIQIDRVTRVVKGGRRLRFRAIAVAGDKEGRVGVACEKGGEVVAAIQKATTKARKNMKLVPLSGTTIPHAITSEYAGAKVFLKPARKGTGVIAGGAVRAVLEVAGVKDIFSKIQGSSSKLNNVYATIKALENLIDIKNESKDTKEKVDQEGEKVPKPKKEKKSTKKSAKQEGHDVSERSIEIKKSGSRLPKNNSNKASGE